MAYPKGILMKKFYPLATLAIVFALSICFHSLSVSAMTGTGNAGDRDAKMIESFLAHVDSLDRIEDATKQKISDAIAAQSESGADAITEGLLLAYPNYGNAIASSDADNVAEGTALLSPLADSDDKFLAADASFYLARLLMNNQRFEDALPRLEMLTRQLAEYSSHQGDAQYYIGVAQAGMLQKDEAVQSFMQFLQFNPDAAERLRVSAWRQIQELQAIEDGKLEDVHHHMDYSRRRLELTETDESTQKEQDDIVKMLGQLIKEQEKKECNSSCKNSSSQKQAQSQPSPPKPQAEPKQGRGQQGGQSSNPNGRVVEKSYDDSPASPWSRLRDRSRDPANNAIKEKLPARYRDIVEKYYEAANGDTDN
jgi:tetratricopeptide (TPR) repeat protein